MSILLQQQASGNLITVIGGRGLDLVGGAILGRAVDAGVCNVEHKHVAAYLKLSNRVEFVHFFLVFLHVVPPFQSPVGPPPSEPQQSSPILSPKKHMQGPAGFLSPSHSS